MTDQYSSYRRGFRAAYFHRQGRQEIPARLCVFQFQILDDRHVRGQKSPVRRDLIPIDADGVGVRADKLHVVCGEISRSAARKIRFAAAFYKQPLGKRQFFGPFFFEKTDKGSLNQKFCGEKLLFR